jgi:hypothetical protein
MTVNRFILFSWYGNFIILEKEIETHQPEGWGRKAFSDPSVEALLQ